METVKKLCCVCEGDYSLLEVRDKWICENCLQIGNVRLVSPWKAALDKLMKEYTEACSACIATHDPRDIHKASITGQKIKGIFDLIGIPKKHSVFVGIRRMNILLKKLRETDVFLDELLVHSEENKVYAEMIRLIRKKQNQLHKLLVEEFPAITNNIFFYKKDLLINKELIIYVGQFVKASVLFDYEGCFQRMVESYHRTVHEKGKTAPDTIEILYSIRNSAKSLRYIYNILNQFFDENAEDKESYYKGLLLKLDEISDVEDLLKQLMIFQNKIDAPKKALQMVKKDLKAKLIQLIEEAEIPKEYFKSCC